MSGGQIEVLIGGQFLHKEGEHSMTGEDYSPHLLRRPTVIGSALLITLDLCKSLSVLG